MKPQIQENTTCFECCDDAVALEMKVDKALTAWITWCVNGHVLVYDMRADKVELVHTFE